MKKTLIIAALGLITFIPDSQALTEICGNGLDDDGDGVFLACPEPDKDNDGYLSTSNDCDDNNYMIYPGVITASGCSSGQTRKCQSNGTFTACSGSTICEAYPGSNCKYIDCQSGSDTSGDGSYNNPWKSFKKIGYYESSGLKPSGWYQLQAGDAVYLKGSGTCSEWYDPGPSLPNSMLFIAASGTSDKPILIKRYPGSTAIMDPPFTSALPGHVIRASGSHYLKVEDLEITGSYGAVLYFSDVHNNEISRVKCHDTQGTTYNNIACLNASADLVGNYFHHNEFYNVYDPDRPGEDNVSTMVLFGGHDNRVEYNRLYYTNSPAYAGVNKGKCFKYKHPGTSGNFDFKGNQLWNCYKMGVENCAAGIRMNHNLLVNPQDYTGAVGYFCGDIGAGISYCKNGVIEYNTLVNFRPISFRESVNAGLGSNTIRYNVAVDNAGSYNSENGFYRVERYGSDANHQTFINNNSIVSSSNCYYNPNSSLKFDFFGDNSSPAGGMYSFSEWQALGFDSSSQVLNPSFNQYFMATASACSNFGWKTGTSESITRPNAPSGLQATVN